ncbi:homeobox protein pnx-like [Choristoneura fumiferana]|uniref:homeobox protein pnx-like n=1 Tax=Choristoneura fumiferana TaxID=7141 RepID=UPI003D159F0C
MENCYSNNNNLHLPENLGFTSGPFIIRNGYAEWRSDYPQQQHSELPIGSAKAKRTRTKFTTEQLSALEKFYRRNNFANRTRQHLVAAQLGLPEKSVRIWFQNRRMRAKKGYVPATQDSAQSLQQPQPCNGNPAVLVGPAEHQHSLPPTSPCLMSSSRQSVSCVPTSSLALIPQLPPAAQVLQQQAECMEVQKQSESFGIDWMVRTYLTEFDDRFYIKFKLIT